MRTQEQVPQTGWGVRESLKVSACLDQGSGVVGDLAAVRAAGFSFGIGAGSAVLGGNGGGEHHGRMPACRRLGSHEGDASVWVGTVDGTDG